MPNQKSNAGNDGDVMKHAPLHKVVEHHSNGKDEFWYVETHAAYPYYYLPNQGSWQAGIGDLVQNQATASTLLTSFANVAYHDKQNVHVRFPDERTYLGSAAQIFHILKDKQKRVRMTLFELDGDPAQALVEYFQGQGAKAVLVSTGGDAGHDAGFLRQSWDAAVASTQQDDFVMVVQGDSYSLAPALWASAAAAKPDLVFVDPFEIDKSGQPAQTLSSLSGAGVSFMCWTPLNGQTARTWKRPSDWTFLQGVSNADTFARHCQQTKLDMAWFSWRKSTGQGMYGCQLTFGNVFNQQFNPVSIWQFPNGNGLPYLDLLNHVARSGQQGPNFQNPATTWQTPGQALNQQSQPFGAANQPGEQWWTKYHAAFWWP